MEFKLFGISIAIFIVLYVIVAGLKDPSPKLLAAYHFICCFIWAFAIVWYILMLISEFNAILLCELLFFVIPLIIYFWLFIYDIYNLIKNKEQKK